VLLGLSATAASQVGETLVVAFPNLPAFEEPVDIEVAPLSNERMYVAEQGGLIFDFEISVWESEPRLVLDLSEKVFDADGEGGFQSFTFAPDFGTSNHVYVHYLAGDDADPDGTRRSVVSRFTMTESGIIDPNSEEVIIEVPQPHHFHNGGKILFGPDEFLYIPFGDGGVNFSVNGQDRATLLGSILRIDPLNPADGNNYGIPSDNPFVGNKSGWREEIWAWGMRNPWRSSFDADGNLWVGDVGAVTWEEIDIIESGKNYGWDVYEAFLCRNEPCEEDKTLMFPVHAYPHDVEVGGFAVIGGAVYEGAYNPNYTGWYIFADAWTNRIWALDPGNPSNVDELVSVGTGSPRLVDFAQDDVGRLFVVGYLSGLVYDVMASFPVSNEGDGIPQLSFDISIAPNPFLDQVDIRLSASESGVIRVSLFDLLGRKVADLFEGEVNRGETRHIQVASSGLAPGVYVVRVEAENEVQTRRITLVD